MREGLFGGTFNPLHNGHITVIRHVLERCGLDTVHLIPSARPPHKPTSDLAPAADRLAMIQQSLIGIPGLVASDVELRRGGASFTIDTVRHFEAVRPPETLLFFILGSDAFLEIGTWRRTREIFQSIRLIVMMRAGARVDIKTLDHLIKDKVSESYQYSQADETFYHPNQKPVHVIDVPEIDISSTRIRERIRRKLSITGLVPDPVETIIIEKGLYQ